MLGVGYRKELYILPGKLKKAMTAMCFCCKDQGPSQSENLVLLFLNAPPSLFHRKCNLPAQLGDEIPADTFKFLLKSHPGSEKMTLLIFKIIIWIFF